MEGFSASMFQQCVAWNSESTGSPPVPCARKPHSGHSISDCHTGPSAQTDTDGAVSVPQGQDLIRVGKACSRCCLQIRPVRTRR